jgi:hypothetical protein
MAFVFDAAPGSSTANSYVSVAEADDYFAAHLESSFWAISAAKKQAALVQATNRIDREKFGGQLTARNTQKLQFPRSYVLSRDSMMVNPDFSDASNAYYYRNPNTIPHEVEQATCEMALYYLKQISGEYSVDDNDLETLTNYKVGPLDLAIKDGIKADRLPTRVAELLKALGSNGWLAGQSLRYTA